MRRDFLHVTINNLSNFNYATLLILILISIFQRCHFANTHWHERNISIEYKNISISIVWTQEILQFVLSTFIDLELRIVALIDDINSFWWVQTSNSTSQMLNDKLKSLISFCKTRIKFSTMIKCKKLSLMWINTIRCTISFKTYQTRSNLLYLRCHNIVAKCIS